MSCVGLDVSRYTELEYLQFLMFAVLTSSIDEEMHWCWSLIDEAC